jgi:putative peptide zinc metalloprotease protein
VSPDGTRAGPPRPARLELLVRRDDDAFEVKEVPSAAAWVKLRPARVPAEQFELAEVTSRVDRARSFILKNAVTDRFLILSEPERFLWERMDGRASIQDLATAYVLRYGAFDFELIPALIRKLQRAQLLTLTPASRLRSALGRHGDRRLLRAAEAALTALERINVSSRRVQPLFVRLYRWGGRLLFTPVALVTCLGLAVLGLAAAVQLWRELGDVAAGLGTHALAAVVGMKLFLLLTLAAHQAVHGLALVHYGRRVREFGFTFLHGIVPTFYVDVTDIFMASRRARVVTAVSGTLVHLTLGSLFFLVAHRAPDGSWLQGFAAASGLLQWQSFLVALYPFCFIEMDGYHVLVDLLGVPTLKHDALGYLKARLTRAPVTATRREAALWLGYLVLSGLSVAAFVAFNVWLVLRATG